MSSAFDYGSPSWAHLLPCPKEHTIRLKDDSGETRVYTIAMFHQLRCLEVLHDAYLDEGSHRTSSLAQHCMNYLRESITCQMDLRAERQASNPTDNGEDKLCFDWEVAYNEVERNYNKFSSNNN